MIDYVPFEARHVAEVAEIERLSFKTPWSERLLRDELDNSLAHYIVAENDGAVVGYIGCYKIADEAHITKLAVTPDMRRKGVASRLIARFLQFLKDDDVTRATLEVNENNSAAVALYEKFGFKPCGRRKKYYEGVDDAIIYWFEAKQGAGTF